jgi:hypothetical protein
MSGWTSRLRLAAVLAVGAIAIAACGGSSNNSSAYSNTSANSGNSGASSTSGNSGSGAPLSKSDYASKVLAAIQPVGTAQDAQKAAPTNPDAWAKISTTASQAHDTIAGLTPPSDVSNLHQQLVATYAAFSTDAGAVATALKSGDTSAVQSAKANYAKDGQELVTLAAQFKAAGVNLG